MTTAVPESSEGETIMTMKKWQLLAAGALALAAALPAAAAPLKIIAVQARIDDLNGGGTRGTLAIGDPVPANVGDRLRVNLVGTAIVNGAGVETPIRARFNVAAGGNNLSIVRGGPTWAEVSVNAAGGNGLAQLAYTAVGDYDMRPGDRSGRITFQIGGGAPAIAPSPGPDDDRMREARRLNEMLYLSILGARPTGPRARTDVERIYRNGYNGVRDVSTALAREAEDSGRGRSLLPRGYEERDVERVGALYRGLLRRHQSDRELWDTDGGFRGTVRSLHDHGLPAVVQGIVSSDEFVSANNMQGFGPR
jgi:hypothetical protein